MKRLLLISLVLAATTYPVSASHLTQNDAVFQVKCGYVKSARIDPIVYPGQTEAQLIAAGLGHQHDFTGNTTTNESSTNASLRAAGTATTSCDLTKDEAAYWMPTLYNNGVAVHPTESNTYYVLTPHDPTIQVFPAGLQMIAGNSAAATEAENPNARWGCEPNNTRYGTVPPCTGTGDVNLILLVTFPNCWNGTNPDSADHKSHMAYSDAAGNCPSTHPVAVPRLKVNFHYKTLVGGTYNPANISLSSGGQVTGHADFMNGWNVSSFDTLAQHCLNGSDPNGAPHNCKQVSDANFPHGTTHSS